MRFTPVLTVCAPLALAALRAGAAPDTQYPFPYQQPTAAGIAAQLARVRDYVAASFPNGRAPYAIDPLAEGAAETSATQRSAATAGDAAPANPRDVLRQLASGPRPVFAPLDYTTGFLYTGLLRAGEATGDGGYRAVLGRQLKLLEELLATAEAEPSLRRPMRAAREPAALDDCGAMTAALLRCREAGIGPDFSAQVSVWSAYIRRGQFRLPDGTLARQRPQPVSVWADDFYMGVEPLLELGRADPAALDDAARDTVQTASRLFRPDRGLFAHGWSADSPGVPDFFWGRANGWAAVTLCDLLDVLAPDHPRRAAVLQLLQAHLRGLAALQSGEGRWHQLLDRPDSYLETSCSAMFVYALAHAINRGWIPAPTFGPIAQVGWLAVANQITPAGQVDQSCIGTTYAGDAVYYYHRPANVNAAHGYGAVFLAGAEMIRLLRNPAVRVEFKNQAFHYVPTRP